jgi:hypothetical protein
MVQKIIAGFLIILLMLSGWPWMPKAYAITCGRGTDIGGGVCREFLTTTGSNQTYTSPADWNNSNNSIEIIGAGGSGAATRGSTTVVATGGGGGAYAKITSFSFATPGTTTATYRVGAGGTAITQSATGNTAGNVGEDSWFNALAFPGAGTDNTKVGAKGGSPGATGANPQSGGAGGVGTSGWGTTRNSGGRGGNSGSFTSVVTGGGGGAGGSGAGGAGVDGAGNSTAKNGGQGDNGSGGTGGSGSTGTGNQTGGNGNPGTEWTTNGSGGGGGGGRTTGNNKTGTGGTGGSWGGGGAGAIASSTTGGVAVSGPGQNGVIVVTYTPETDPPTPNPMTFATVPNNDAVGQISMVATTATDVHTVQYLFTFVACGANGGTGGTSSSYQSPTSYTDNGLDPNKCYGYNVTAKDSLGNTGSASTPNSTTYSSAATPSTPTLGTPTSSTLALTNNENGNPASNPTTLFAATISSTSPTDSAWLGKWINGSGNAAASEVWLTDAQLTETMNGLQSSTTYGVQVKAKNEDGDITPLSSEGTGTTSSANSAPYAPSLLFANERATTAQSGVLSPVVALGDATPALSAVYTDPDAGNHAVFYEIIVYSDACSTQVWDSGQVALTSCDTGNRCQDITYGGTTPFPFDGATYRWKIKYWDSGGLAGAYSGCTDNFTILGPGNQMRHGEYFFNNTTERVYTW